MTVRVLYIGGSGRSGSTLVDRIIGQLPGFVSTGELRVISQAGMGENRLCGCGASFDECPFWTRVGGEAFGGWERVDRDALHRAGANSYRDALRSILDKRVQRHGSGSRALARLYRAISEAADGATIIDSSKGPRYGALLATVPGLEVRAIHLVRDSRGVAYSWSKTVTRPDVPGRTVEMLRMRPPEVAVRWILHNAMMELLGRRIPVVRVCYEAFLADPRTELSRILSVVASPPGVEALDFIGPTSTRLRANHTVMGNPMRMLTGDVPLRLDDAWRTAMPVGSRTLVAAITWPMLLRYGYSLR